MSCAENAYFQKEHIEKYKFEASEELAEQAVHCLELVSELASEKLYFQFKGGNSLLLVFSKPYRFSIDVDIAADESTETIEKILDAIVKKYGVFTRWEKRSHKTKPWIPLSSYYCFFHSHFRTNGENNIMLDVQLHRSPYETQRVPAVCGNLYASPITIEIPTAASICGDKLLTLGPETLGIPVGKGKGAQRIKHIFDVARIIDARPCLDSVRKSFFACLNQENTLQQRSLQSDEVVGDTLRFCGSALLLDAIPALEASLPEALKETVRGLLPFAQHLFAQRYHWDELRNDLCRTALCITAVCVDSVDNEQFERALDELVGDARQQARRAWLQITQWLKGDPLK